MSDPRSTYPQAKAWTFLLDNPGDTGSSGSSTKAAPQKALAAGGGGRAAGAKARGKRKTSLGDSSNCSGGEDMGAMCSKPSNANLATDKENMEEMLVPNGDSSGGGGGETCKSAGEEVGIADSEDPKVLANGGGVLAAAMLDSTAFLSPEPETGKEGGEEDGNSAVDENGVVISGLEIERGGHAGSYGDGHMRYEDRAEWIARNLEMLPRGSCAVEVDQLKQLPGLENCLHELLLERARHLTAMDSLTNQLRRREAEATKHDHDVKALAARLECTEQDKSALERRARAAGEEHRVERARWFVHKQELETRCVQLESRDTQYRASIRKKEVEYGRLQDALRRTADKSTSIIARGAGAKGGARGRGIETNQELSPGEAPTDGGRSPLGGVLNEQAVWKVEELETENKELRSMLVDLQGEVMDLKGYHDRHGDLVSAGRGSIEGGIWGGRMSVEPLPAEVIEGMPADWLERQLGEETARQIKGMRGALKRVLGDGEGGDGEGGEGKEGGAEDSTSQEDLASLVSQLREARSLLREQDAIMFAAIFDRPGADVGIRQRCVCGADCEGLGGSGVWDSLERLEQEREELERERSKLEKDKARFLEEAVRRDSKSFVFSCPPATPTPATPAIGDRRYATPTHANGQQQNGGAGKLGELTVATASPNPAGRSANGGGDVASLPLMTFTPPGASPDTSKLLGQLGIKI